MLRSTVSQDWVGVSYQSFFINVHFRKYNGAQYHIVYRGSGTINSADAHIKMNIKDKVELKLVNIYPNLHLLATWESVLLPVFRFQDNKLKFWLSVIKWFTGCKQASQDNLIPQLPTRQRDTWWSFNDLANFSYIDDLKITRNQFNILIKYYFQLYSYMQPGSELFSAL